MKTGIAPSSTMGLALAMKVRVEQRTRSPGPTPAMRNAKWSAAVPEETATAWGASTAIANSRSNASR